MNEEVSEKQKDGDTIKDLEHFRKQYAMVLVQLRDANDQVRSKNDLNSFAVSTLMNLSNQH